MAIKEKEKILMVVQENIPEELKELKQWCCFKLQLREDKMTKIPVSAYNGSPAKSNDENTWSDFETALEAIEKFNLDGLGFFFKAPYFGIDIDGVKEEIERFHNDDHDNNIVSEFIDMMCSYSEISVSGTGIHIIAKGELPDGARRRGNIEMYDSGRFFVMTGNPIGTYTRVEEDEFNKVNYLHNKYLHKQKVPATRNEMKESKGTSFTEEELINIALKSKIGGRFQVFMEGGWEQFYNSQSEADMAFANDLSFWTNCDYTMMDSIFRRSSLMRDKWDRTQNSSTYGDKTLRKAIADCTNTFEPEPKQDNFQMIINENDSFVFPKGFVSKNGCLYNIVEKKDRSGEIEELEVLICRQTPIITRSFMNVEHPQLYHELTWLEKGKEYNEVIPAGDLAIKKELLKLSYKSLAVNDNNAKNLITYFDRLCMVNNLDHEYLVERLGHIKNTFVHPLTADGVKILPPDVGEIQLVEAFQTSGTSEEWIENVFKPIKNHSKALLMVLASFTSVLLQDLKMKPFIVDLSGMTSQGKTTVLRACASVWGTEHLVSEWNLTKVAAERKASFLNSFPLILDDTRKADEKQLQGFIYNFSGGRSKGRGSVSGSQREYTWGNLLLSTGEDSLNAYAERAGGVAARILPITGLPFQGEDYQFFTDLYNAIENYYGSIGLEFLNQWREKKRNLIPHFAEYNDVFQKKSQGNEVIGRIARYYAAIIFTGRLLNEFFGLEIDLMQLYRLFDELNAENKAVDKPMQLLEAILSDLDADRGAIFNNYFEPRSGIKAIYKNDSLHLLPAYLKEFLKSEEKTIRSEWLRREITVPQASKGKTVDYKQVKHKGRNFSGVPIQQKVVEELGFDFSEEFHA